MQKTIAITFAFTLATTAVASPNAEVTAPQNSKPLPWFDRGALHGTEARWGTTKAIEDRYCGTASYCDAVDAGGKIDGIYTSTQACYDAHEKQPANGLLAWIDPVSNLPDHVCKGEHNKILFENCGTYTACMAIDQGKMVDAGFSSTNDCFEHYDLPSWAKGRCG